jgi:hypothetical protein
VETKRQFIHLVPSMMHNYWHILSNESVGGNTAMYGYVFGMYCTYVLRMLICNLSGGFYHYFILGVAGVML